MNYDNLSNEYPPSYQFEPEEPREERADTHLGFETRALHAGYNPHEDYKNWRSFVPPIVQSMTYPFPAFGETPTYIYGRNRNPTTNVLEERIAALEGGAACITAGSGSQSLYTLILTLARPGDNVVTSMNLFGEGFQQAVAIFPERSGIEFHIVEDASDPDAWDQAIDDRTRLVWVETPSNPTLFVTDIAAVADVAHARNVPLMVDNTIATSALQQPLSLGADIVLLSITKFLSGNASVLGGAIVGPSHLVLDIRKNVTELIGSTMQPIDAWMTLQYLETLALRMERHSQNTQKVAEFLNEHPKVVLVNYPGLPEHPQHDLAQKQMLDNGGMLSFEVVGGVEGAATVMDSTELIVHAITFGTSRSIFMHPPTGTHNHMTPEERAKAGIGDGLIRLSVGLERVDDIIRDLDQAMRLI